MKPHYNPANCSVSTRKFIPIQEWSNIPRKTKEQSLTGLDLLQWQIDIICERHEILKNTPRTQLLDFDTVMDEMEKRYGI
jgi:hypothetical protein